MFGEKFGHLGIDLESVLPVMSRHPQYGCVAQIKEQLLNRQRTGVLRTAIIMP